MFLQGAPPRPAGRGDVGAACVAGWGEGWW